MVRIIAGFLIGICAGVAVNSARADFEGLNYPFISGNDRSASILRFGSPDIYWVVCYAYTPTSRDESFVCVKVK